MNNNIVPWFVLVPEVENITELYELDKDTQLLLLDDINKMSSFIKDNFKVDKLNVASIGNIVKQLHVHVIGRSRSDVAWPGVVWGIKEQEAYSQEEIDNIIQRFNLVLGKQQ